MVFQVRKNEMVVGNLQKSLTGFVEQTEQHAKAAKDQRAEMVAKAAKLADEQGQYSDASAKWAEELKAEIRETSAVRALALAVTTGVL